MLGYKVSLYMLFGEINPYRQGYFSTFGPFLTLRVHVEHLDPYHQGHPHRLKRGIEDEN